MVVRDWKCVGGGTLQTYVLGFDQGGNFNGGEGVACFIYCHVEVVARGVVLCVAVRTLGLRDMSVGRQLGHMH